MANRVVRYHVGGMACSFCAESIETAYERTDGVADVDVSLAHEEVLVRYDDDRVGEVALKDALRDLGYTIRDPDERKRFEQQRAELAEGKRRLVAAGSASAVTTALMLWMLLVRGTFESATLGMDLLALALALGTTLGPGRYILVKAYNSLRRGILNQHVLLEAGASAGLVGGLLGLSVFPGFPTVHFFAVTTFVTTYHVLSEYTGLFVRARASRAVQNLLDLRPDTARRVLDEGGESGGTPGDSPIAVEEVPVDDLAVGDRVRVKPGESIPVDGEVVAGASTVDESVATGESVPEEKQPGDEVIGGSVNGTGALVVAVTATGEDAFLNRVAREVEAARTAKPRIVRLADRILEYFVPGVLAVAALSALFWLVVPAVWPGGPFGAGPDVRRGAFAALAVLVLGYPCALGMATPLALVRGGWRAADRGILLRSADAFEVLPDVDHVVLDKTGTMTVGDPTVAEVATCAASDAAGASDGAASDDGDVLATAASAEALSEHPLAAAIVDHADDLGVEYAAPESFDAVTGRGVTATVDGDDVWVGTLGWLESQGVDCSAAGDAAERLRGDGLTVSGVARDGVLVGLVGVGDGLRDDAPEAVRRMEEAGLTPVMLTGDDGRTAAAVADAVGIDHVLADVPPDGKREAVARLQDEGHRVAMVGDGINDAPALAQADVGVAVGAGTDVAIESADVVLLDDRLGGVMDAREIGTESYRKTRQNLLAAFSFNGVGVAAATTGLVHPVFAMVAMVASVSTVLANSFAGRMLDGERTGVRPRDAS